jgi:hypothetical protein
LPVIVTVSDKSAIVQFGRFRVVPHRRELLVDGRTLKLGGRTFDVLMELIEASGGVVSKDKLLSRIWPDRIVEENRLQGKISALRKAFGADRDLIRLLPVGATSSPARSANFGNHLEGFRGRPPFPSRAPQRTRSGSPASIGSNQSSRRWTADSASNCRAGDVMLLLVMAQSPPACQRRDCLGLSTWRLRHPLFQPHPGRHPGKILPG